jgi:hypothetical protein
LPATERGCDIPLKECLQTCCPISSPGAPKCYKSVHKKKHGFSLTGGRRVVKIFFNREIPVQGPGTTYPPLRVQSAGATRRCQKAADLLSENATPSDKREVQYWERLATLYNKAGNFDREFKTLVQGIKTVKENTPLFNMAMLLFNIEV